MKIIICALFCFTNMSFSEAGADAWELIVPTLKRGEATHIEPLPNGDILVAGHASTTSPNLTGAWVTRITPDGYEVWSQEITGMAYSRVSDLKLENDRFIVAGTHMSPMRPIRGHSVAYLAALSYDGEVLWETRLSEPQASVWVKDIQVLKSQDYLVTGAAEKHEDHKRGWAYYAVIEPDGSLKWSRSIEPLDAYSNAAPSKIFARDKDGNEIIREVAGNVVEQDDGRFDAYIRRRDFFSQDISGLRCVVLNESGKVLEFEECAESVSAPSSSSNKFYPYDVKRVGPNHISARRIQVTKQSEDGTALWDWTYPNERQAGLTDAVLTDDGGLIGVGFLVRPEHAKYHQSDAVIFRLDADGNELWAHVYASDRRDTFARIVPAEDDDFYVIGHTGADAFREWDPWILRVDDDGIAPSIVARK